MRNTKLVLSNRELCELKTLIDDFHLLDDYDQMSGDAKHILDQMAELTGSQYARHEEETT